MQLKSARLVGSNGAVTTRASGRTLRELRPAIIYPDPGVQRRMARWWLPYLNLLLGLGITAAIAVSLWSKASVTQPTASAPTPPLRTTAPGWTVAESPPGREAGPMPEELAELDRLRRVEAHMLATLRRVEESQSQAERDFAQAGDPDPMDRAARIWSRIREASRRDYADSQQRRLAFEAQLQ